MVVTPTMAVASPSSKQVDMAEIGHQSQEEGLELVKEAMKNPPKMQGNQLQLPGKDGQTVNITTEDIIPGTSDTVKYRTDASAIDQAKAGFDRPGDLTDQGEENKKGLYEDSQSDKPSIEGQAYSILVDMSNKNLTNKIHSDDSVFKATNEVYKDIDKITQGLSDCSADTVFKKVTSVKHYPDYKRCTQVMDRSGACKLYHNYQAGVIRHFDGAFNFKSCGKGCAEMWLSRPFTGGGNSGKYCKLHEFELKFKVLKPDAIIKATISDIYWDDQMQLFLGPVGKERKILQLPYADQFVPEYFKNPQERPEFVYPGPFSGANPQSCEQRWSWYWRNTELDITKHLKNAQKNDVYRFHMRVAIAGNIGGAYAKLRVYYDPTKAVHDESWTPNSCLEAAWGVQDGFAKGKVVCVKNPADSSGCAWIEGVEVCPEYLNPSPLKGIPNLCQEVSVSADFGFYKGQMDCWTDVHGVRQCPVNNGGNLDTCKQYETNPQCGFVSSKCTDGAQGASGQCYVNDVIYDCGSDVKVETTQSDTQYKCPGAIKCMGSECIDTTKTNSTDFAKVTALLNAAQYMSQDMTCTGIGDDGNFTGQENVTCTVFSGDPSDCKIAVGGVSNCCESQPGIGLPAYLSMIKSVADMNSALTTLAGEEGSPGIFKDIAGQYVNVKGEAADVIKEGVDWISKPFTSYIENISTGIKDFVSPIKDVVGGLCDELKQKCAEVMTNIFKQAGMDTAGAVGGATATETGKTVADGAANQLAGQAMAMFSVVSAIYTAYVVATMIIQSVYKCTDEEFELVAQRDLKNCHYIGSYCKNKKLGMCIEKRESYCCYKSPLSRIINEQIRMQGDILGQEFDGFGTARNPKCMGVPLEKVGDIDWDRINLDEWIALLEQNGQLPNETTVDLDKLTGKGSKLDIHGDRLNTLERVQQKIQEIDVDGVRTEANESIDVDTGYVGGKH